MKKILTTNFKLIQIKKTILIKEFCKFFKNNKQIHKYKAEILIIFLIIRDDINLKINIKKYKTNI
jgi:hypothetical protein